MSCETGKVYGLWLVLKKVVKPKNLKDRGLYFLCECQCDKKTQRTVNGRSLRRGFSKSCGCINREKSKGKSEVGKTYGMWKVIELAVKPSHRKGNGLYFLCECQCVEKTRKIIKGHNLRQRTTMSCGCEMKKARNADAPYNYLMFTYKRSAKRRKLQFSLLLGDMKDITQKNCFYCNKSPSSKLKTMYKHDFLYNGIDRFDNNKGYSKNNCVPCCKSCNIAKMQMSFKEFYEWICNVYHFLKEKEGVTLC